MAKRTKKRPSQYKQHLRKKKLDAFKAKTRGKPWTQRNHLGHYISKEDFLFRQRELSQRAREYKADKRYAAQQKAQQKKREREERRKRFAKAEREWARGARDRSGKLKTIFTNRTAATARTVGDNAQLHSGKLPPSHTRRNLGNVEIRKWVYFGDSAISTAEAFLIEARDSLSPGTLASVRIGTSYDKRRGEWVSTPILPLKAQYGHGKDVLSALFRLLSSESGATVFGGDSEDVDVWVEVELLMV